MAGTDTDVTLFVSRKIADDTRRQRELSEEIHSFANDANGK